MNARILVVDDEQNLQSLYQKELQAEGYDVLMVKDAQEALIQLNNESVDLVVFDLRLPEGSGLNYLQRIVDVSRNAKLIIHADYAPNAMDFNFWAADACVAKSSDLTELKILIDKILHPN